MMLYGNLLTYPGHLLLELEGTKNQDTVALGETGTQPWEGLTFLSCCLHFMLAPWGRRATPPNPACSVLCPKAPDALPEADMRWLQALGEIL